MSIFGNMTSQGMDVEPEDRLGGFTLYDTDIYNATIKMAYAMKSQGGAQGLFLEFDLGQGRTYRETVYFTTKQGTHFYLTDNKKKAPLPGFTLIDDICLLTTDTPLSGQETAEKTVKVYDPEQKKELPRSVPVLTELLGKEISLAIVRSLNNKREKASNGEYMPTAETREENNIEKAFHTPSKLTVVEARNGKDTGEFWDKWLEKNKGQVRDKRKIKNGPTGGMPGAPGGRTGSGPPQSTAGSPGQAPKKSLFGKP